VTCDDQRVFEARTLRTYLVRIKKQFADSDLGWGEKSGSGMNIPDKFSERLKILKFLDADRDPGSF
jgi:hypothetical protein